MTDWAQKIRAFREAQLPDLTASPRFRHPFSGTPTSSTFPPTERLAAIGDETQIDSDHPVDQFWLLWRLWVPSASSSLPSAPADWARLPADLSQGGESHWGRRTIASALVSATDSGGRHRPALLRVQFGPTPVWRPRVEQAEELRHHSLLCSWLIAHGLQAVTESLGPDVVLTPWLRGHPLWDWLHRERLRQARRRVAGQSIPQTVWEELGWENEPDGLMTGSLPNSFVAIVPCDYEANFVIEALDREWQRIVERCWRSLEERGRLGPEIHRLWQGQAKRPLACTWQLWPCEDVAATLERLNTLPAELAASLRRALAVQEARSQLRDKPAAIPGKFGPLLAWNAHVELLLHRQAARGRTCDFSPWPVAPPEPPEAALPSRGHPSSLAAPPTDLSSELKRVLAQSDRLGVLDLIVRLWRATYLKPQGFPDITTNPDPALTPALALAPNPTPTPNLTQNDNPTLHISPIAPRRTTHSPLALLRLRADDLDSWFSGRKAPPLRSVLCAEETEPLSGALRNVHSSKGGLGEDWLDSPCPGSPVDGLQFSEALANFGLRAAPRIVAAHRGQLIQTSGEELLAVLSADQVFACARSLRLAFQGSPSLAQDEATNFAATDEGFICLKAESGAGRAAVLRAPSGPLLVPGPSATFSASITIGGRPPHGVRPSPGAAPGNSLTVTWFVQRGSHEWRTAFSSPAVAWLGNWSGVICANGTLASRPAGGGPDGRFFRQLTRLLRPYLSPAVGESECVPLTPELAAIVQREVDGLIDRQRQPTEPRAELVSVCQQYVTQLQQTKRSLEELVQFCNLAAFLAECRE